MELVVALVTAFSILIPLLVKIWANRVEVKHHATDALVKEDIAALKRQLRTGGAADRVQPETRDGPD